MRDDLWRSRIEAINWNMMYCVVFDHSDSQLATFGRFNQDIVRPARYNGDCRLRVET